MTLRFASSLVLGLAAGAVGLPACAAGSGELVTYESLGRDDPGAPRDAPPSSQDNTSGACIQCDVSYDCSGSAFASRIGQLQLTTSGGTCVKALIDLVCSGALFGASGCSGGGGGPFSCGGSTCSPSGTQGFKNVTTTVGGTLPPTVTPSGPSGGSMSSPGFAPDAG
jgi:hypothetical protein